MIRWTVRHREETESTNLDARDAAPGEVFTASFQRAGRGRLDHRWLSPPEANLLMSAVLDVAGWPVEEACTLPLAVGLAVRDTVAAFTSARVTVKWPNDVLVEGRKIAGILCERRGDRVIAGIGVNVLHQPFAPEIAARATALADSPGATDITVAAVRDRLLDRLAARVETLAERGFAALYPALTAADALKGRILSVRQTEDDPHPVRGLCGGIRPDGSLDVGGTPVYAGEAHVMPADA